MGRHKGNGQCFGDVMDVCGMGVALVTSQGGSNVEMDVVWYKNEAVGGEVTSESGSVALIDFLYFFPSLQSIYGEDEEDIEMAPTPKQRKLCSRLGLKASHESGLYPDFLGRRGPVEDHRPDRTVTLC